jgi:DNA helicase INO80
MSFASILSEPTEESAPRRASPPPPPPPSQSARPELAPVTPLPQLEKRPSLEKQRPIVDRDGDVYMPLERDIREKEVPVAVSPVPRPPRLTEKDMEVIQNYVAEIDRAEKSDVEDGGFEADFHLFIAKSKKRAVDADLVESQKRKVIAIHTEKRKRKEKLIVTDSVVATTFSTS